MAHAFRDRREAGRVLAGALGAYTQRSDVIVLALPRGGVPVAFEVAQAISAPLDVFVVRKLGVPGHEELAMGAVASGGVRVLNDSVVRELHVTDAELDAVTRVECAELARRERSYRDDRPAPVVAGKTVILVDDGLATGASMRAAIGALRAEQVLRVTVAVPAAAPSVCAEIASEVDDIVCAITPEPFYAVGMWYRDFSPTTDDEVRDLLNRAWRGSGSSDPLRSNESDSHEGG